MDSYGVKRKVDMLGRVTIPKSFRDDLHIDIGDIVEVCRIDGAVVVKSVSEVQDNESTVQA